ncbi:MAG: DUF2809 domain-containing protein [Bacteroidales bacterium]|nr:DUF2809 domain-containing protein [Bacteroidales bacterium]
MTIFVVTALGFGSKLYSGIGSGWFNNSLAGLFYEIFWCLVVFIIHPRLNAFKIASGVFFITSVLEFLQLWHPPFLQMIRSTFIGSALIGNSFNWLDFPYYLAGCITGVIIMRYLDHSSGKNNNHPEKETGNK